MPDVDWEKVAEALDTYYPTYRAVTEGGPFAEDLIVAAARWALEAQQRGRFVWWCETHGATGTRQGCFRWLAIDSKVFDCVIGERLLVPLEGEQ